MELPDTLEPFLTDELIEGVGWVTAGITSPVRWPGFVCRAQYCDRPFWLLPETKRTPPAVTTFHGRDDFETAATRLMRFLSALAWGMKCGIDTNGVGGSGRLRVIGSPVTVRNTTLQQFSLPTLPEPATQEAATALALMREARAINHPALRFLTYYRVIETGIAPDERGPWIASQLNSLHNLKSFLDSNSLSHLPTEPDAISHHVYRTRRDALAHAYAKKGTVVDPDDVGSRRQIALELPLMDLLAERVIEDRHRMPKSDALFRQS